jgi:hypothetical protein
MLGQKDLFFRYARFADALYSEMRAPGQDMQMCMHHLAVHVLTASHGARQLSAITVTAEQGADPTTRSHAHVMHMQNRAHLKLFELVNARNMGTDETKALCIEEVKLLTPVFDDLAADRSKDPNVLGRALCNALLSYFKFKSGDTHGAITHLGDLLQCVEHSKQLLRLPAMWTCLMAILLLFEVAGAEPYRLRLQVLLQSHNPPAIANDETTELHAVEEMRSKLASSLTIDATQPMMSGATSGESEWCLSALMKGFGDPSQGSSSMDFDFNILDVLHDFEQASPLNM